MSNAISDDVNNFVLKNKLLLQNKLFYYFYNHRL